MNPNADAYHEKVDSELEAEAARVANVTQADCREIAKRLRFIADDQTEPDDAADILRAAEILETPSWFSAAELLTVAQAMLENGYTNDDSRTMRRQLEKWSLILEDLRPTFAEFLRTYPNGGNE